MDKVCKVKEFDDICVNLNGTVKIFLNDKEVVEIEKEIAYQLGLFLYNILDLVTPKTEEEIDDYE